jgi:hypothetical protein
MSPYRQPAPRGFRWADQPVGRAIVTVLAILSLVLSLFVGYRYVGLIDCLQDRAVADGERTKRIADATDVERRADLALLMGVPDEVTDPAARRAAGKMLLAAAVEARRATDRVRAENPAPTAAQAACH